MRRAGRAAGRNGRGGQSRGDERGPRGAVGDDAARADPRTDRDRHQQADRGGGEQDRHQQRALVSPAQPPQQHARHAERTADDHHGDRKRGLRRHPDEVIGGVLRQRRRDVLDHGPVAFGRAGGHQRQHVAVGDVVAGKRDVRRQRGHARRAGEFISGGRQFGGTAAAQHLVDRDDRRIDQRGERRRRRQHEIDLMRVAGKDRHPARRRHLDRGRGAAWPGLGAGSRTVVIGGPAVRRWWRRSARRSPR